MPPSREFTGALLDLLYALTEETAVELESNGKPVSADKLREKLSRLLREASRDGTS